MPIRRGPLCEDRAVTIQRRVLAPEEALPEILALAGRVWLQDPARLNFETSFGTIAWEGGGIGRIRAFDRADNLAGWARLVPGYDRIRSEGSRDLAPPQLIWQIDLDDPDPAELLNEILDWAEERAEALFTTSHTRADDTAAAVLVSRGYEPDPTEPFSMYLQQELKNPQAPTLDGYRFITMEELNDLEARAEVHRRAWDGSTRNADDVRRTMDTWPYKPSLDFIAVADDGAPAASVIGWYDSSFRYGEFEPMGTVPEHRGRGLGAAILRFGLHKLHVAGASHALVGARADADYPVPRRLYRSVGFADTAIQDVRRQL